jgi:hypothetical protein
MASFVRVTPVWYVVGTNATTGWRPFQVMGRANPTTASHESSNAPFPWFSRMPQQRSTGWSLLWYGGGIRQPHMEGILPDNIDHPLHTWGAPAVIFWAIIQSEPEGGEGGEPFADGLPPLHEAIHQTVTRPLRGHAGHKPFLLRGQAEAHGGPRRRRSHIRIGRCNLHATLPATGTGPTLDGCLGVECDPSHIRCGIGRLVAPDHLVEDGVGLGNFLGGGLFATCLGQSPRSWRCVVIVCTVGRAASVSPVWAMSWRRTSAALRRVYRRVVRNGGSV